MADWKVRADCWLYGRRHRAEFGATRPLEGNVAHMGLDERYWWGYKYYWGPIERAEPGSGLEEHFRGQDLDFSPAPGFEETGFMTLCAGGDIMPHPGINPRSTGALWDDVRDFYCSGDVVYANLESPVDPSAPPGYVPKSILEAGAFNTDPALLDRITDGGRGVNFFSTANNHCLDMGEGGLRATLDLLDSRGFPHIGTARSPEERDAACIVERRGVRVGFVSFTFGLNGRSLPEDRGYLANYVRLNKSDADISPIARQVAAARAAGADVVVALLHWSLEFEAYPARHVVEMGHRLVELGIDAIVGNHPHNVQPVEKYSYVDQATGERRRGLIIYALGDLVSIHKTLPNSRLAALARIRISKGRTGGRERALVSGFELLPVYLRARLEGKRFVDYRILDLRRLAAELRAGKDRWGLGRSRRRELFRLEALMGKLLGPALQAHRA